MPRRAAVFAVVVALLLLGGGTAAYVELSAEARYPDRYLVQENEMPTGLRTSAIPAEARMALGIEENPGRLSEQMLERLSASDARPVDGYAQLLGGTSAEVVVFALRFDTREDAQRWTATAADDCPDGLLRDRTIVLLVMGEGSRGEAQAERVRDVLEDKSPRLQAAC